MSQSGSESDIWDYKPLKKNKKRSCKSQESRKHVTKRRKESNPGTSVQKLEVKSAETHTDLDHQIGRSAPNNTVNSGSQDVYHGTASQDVPDADPQSGGFCPVCQMPFSILVVQSQQWHVAECLDTAGDNCKGNGLNVNTFVWSPKGPPHIVHFGHLNVLTQGVSNWDLGTLKGPKQSARGAVFISVK